VGHELPPVARRYLVLKHLRPGLGNTAHCAYRLSSFYLKGEAANCRTQDRNSAKVRSIAPGKFCSCRGQLCRPALEECSEAVERFGEIVSRGGKAEAEMRGHIEAIAGSQQDSPLGGGLTEPAVILSAH